VANGEMESHASWFCPISPNHNSPNPNYISGTCPLIHPNYY